MTRSRKHVAVAAVAAVTILLATGCGEGGEEQAETQPAPAVTTFEQGSFDELPLLPDSERFGPRSEKDGVVAQTYRTNGVTPQEVVDHFEQELPPAGWRMAEPVHRGDTESRGDWVTDEWRLEVSAAPVPDRRHPSSPEEVVQYSLVLRPR